MTTVSTPAGSYLLKSITYTIPSATEAGKEYTVSVDPATKLMSCTCPARRQCWHQKAVIAGMAGKPRMRIQPIPAQRARDLAAVASMYAD